MKTLAWAILISVFTYWLAIEPAKKQATEAIKAEIAQQNGGNENTNVNVNTKSASSIEIAQNIVAESRSRGLPRKVTEEITLKNITLNDNKIISIFIFDRPASMPIPKDMISAAKNEILINFKNSPMCKTPNGRRALQSNIEIQQFYFLDGGKNPEFSIKMGIKNC